MPKAMLLFYTCTYSMTDFFRQFILELGNTGILELIAVVFGILSVWFSKKENIFVYPVGLVNTTFYVYLSFKAHLFGEASVNLYYTIVSLYGWYLWSRKSATKKPLLKIRFSNRKDWITQLLFFAAIYLLFYFSLKGLRDYFSADSLPLPDAFATASAFTAMWLMARKKLESWYWWIATNIASIPLYYVKGFALTSVYYFILLLMAYSGLAEWRKKAIANKKTAAAESVAA